LEKSGVTAPIMSLLLTGATGFLGRNILLSALTEGREVFAPVRNPDKLGQQLRFEKQDAQGVRVLSALPQQWPKLSPRYAILGAGALFERARSDYFCTNVDWTLAALRALPEQCRTVVISSQSAGGPTPPGKASRTEDDRDAPITWYGESKLAMEVSIRREFPNRPITILRPAMILGPRDTATLPLFRMARRRVRIKPGLHPKTYSFIAVEDLVGAIFLTLEQESLAKSLYVASAERVTDWQLIASAATVCNAKGITLPVPQALVGILARAVDASPTLRAQAPSLTRDRVRELWPSRWVVDGSKFEQLTGWSAKTDFCEALRAAHGYYLREGKL
jgi:nucleoside-diphosphate-sugar epimerase